MIHVLVFTQHYSPEENAPAIRWSWLAPRLSEHDISVHIMTATWSDDVPTHETDGAVTISRVRHVVGARGLPTRVFDEIATGVKSAWRAMRCKRPDVIIVTAPPLGGLPVSETVSRVLRVPLVLELRDTWPELFDEWQTWSDFGNQARPVGGRRLLLRAAIPLARRYLQRLKRRASLIVTTSDRFTQHLNDQGCSQTLCIRNTAADPTPQPALSSDADCLKVLYLGNVGRAQLLATAVRAAAKVQATGTCIQLRIVGDGAHLEKLRALAQELDAPVEFVPKVSRNNAAIHYEWADTILIMLRNWSALRMAVPSKLYDALQSNRHITASIAGETAEIVTRTDAGHVVAPQDVEALAQLWIRLQADRSLLRRNSTGQQWIQQHANAETLAADYARALHAVAGR